MEQANISLALNGSRGHVIKKYGVTPSEVAVLRFLHGDDSVFDIEVLPEGIKKTHRLEIARLSNTYGRQEGERRVSPAVDALFPGAAARCFDTFKELEIPEEFFANFAQNVQVATPEVPLSDLTLVALQNRAAALGIDLTGIKRKGDIIEAIEARLDAIAQASEEDDTDDEGVDDMSDDIGKANVLG